MGMVNAYLLETDNGLVLVDAGWPNKTEVIFKAVQESGHNPGRARRKKGVIQCRERPGGVLKYYEREAA